MLFKAEDVYGGWLFFLVFVAQMPLISFDLVYGLFR